MTAELRAVDIATMIDVDDRDGAGRVIDALDDPVRAAPGAEPVRQRGKRSLADRYGARIRGPVMNRYAATATASGSPSLSARGTVGVVRSLYGSVVVSSLTGPRIGAGA